MRDRRQTRPAQAPAGSRHSPRAPRPGPRCDNSPQSARPQAAQIRYRRPACRCAPGGTRRLQPSCPPAACTALPPDGVLTTQPDPRLVRFSARIVPIRLMLLAATTKQAPGKVRESAVVERHRHPGDAVHKLLNLELQLAPGQVPLPAVGDCAAISEGAIDCRASFASPGNVHARAACTGWLD